MNIMIPSEMFNGRTWFSNKHTKIIKIMDNPRPKNWFLFASETGVFNFRCNVSQLKNKSSLLNRKNCFRYEKDNYIFDQIGKIKSDETIV